MEFLEGEKENVDSINKDSAVVIFFFLVISGKFKEFLQILRKKEKKTYVESEGEEEESSASVFEL